jgi:cytochrome oxidase assembly protein ShyY1
MYRFLVSRRWIAAAAVVAAFSVACVELGLWQLRRLDQRKTLNAAISSSIHQPAAPLAEVLASGRPLYRHVTVTGRYDISQELLLTGRAFNDRPGSDVLTPLTLPDKRALIVNRGFVPLSVISPRTPATAPPDGTVTVTGILLPTEQRGFFGQKEPVGVHLTTIPRIDIPRIRQQLPYDVVPEYLLLSTQTPQQPTNTPQPESFLPDLGNGPHLSYAIQWFFFASFAIAAYAVVAFRTARKLHAA